MYWTLELASYLSDAPWPMTKAELIDYAIIEKPILYIETGNLNTQAVFQFLEGNYEQQFIISNPERYRIETVSKQFLKLI